MDKSAVPFYEGTPIILHDALLQCCGRPYLYLYTCIHDRSQYYLDIIWQMKYTMEHFDDPIVTCWPFFERFLVSPKKEKHQEVPGIKTIAHLGSSYNLEKGKRCRGYDLFEADNYMGFKP